MDTNYNAFSGGVEPGGLRNSSEIKLLICYLLKSLDKPVPRQVIEAALQYDGLVNFFEVGAGLSELANGGNILRTTENGSEYYTLTDQGRRSTDTLQFTLPEAVREKALKAAIMILARRRNERESRVDIVPCGNMYNVTVAVLEDSGEMMSVTLKVADKYQAEYIKQKFLDDPSRVYRNTLLTLIGDELGD